MMMREEATWQDIIQGLDGDNGNDRAMHFLCIAVRQNEDPGVLEACASYCHDISACGPSTEGMPPLHIGAIHGSIQAMDVLLRLGARIDAKDGSKSTALHLAVQFGQLRAVCLLVTGGADLEAQDWLGKTSLHHACIYARMNNLDNNMATLLVNAGADMHSVDFCRCTPATLAMENSTLVVHMLRSGSRPRKELACLYDAQCRCSPTVSRLVEVFVMFGWAPPPSISNDVNDGSADIKNKTPNVRFVASDEFEGENEKGSQLHNLVTKHSSLGDLQMLLLLGEDPDALDSNGQSPLHLAACNGNVAVVKELLSAGADLSLKYPPCGLTALHLSVVSGRFEVSEMLVAAALSNSDEDHSPPGYTSPTSVVAPSSSIFGDAKPSSHNMAAKTGKGALSPSLVIDAKDDAGRSPLHLAAATHSSIHVLESLLRAGADVDSRDKRNRTPLFYAVKEDEAGVVRALLAAGASPNLRDCYKRTPLHTAVLRPAGAVLKALIDGGASAGAGGERGFTPLHAACESNTRGTVEALLRAGAIPGHCWNDFGQSPLIVACRAESLEAVGLLIPRLSVRQMNMQDRAFGADAGGETPLVAAVLHGCHHEPDVIGIVEALLKGGADPTLKTSAGWGPLGAVVVGNRTKSSSTLGPSLIRTLVAAGANVNDVCGPDGFVPLHFACLHGACREVIKALLDAGADACTPCAGSMPYVGMHFMTPLQLAGAGGNAEAVGILIEQPGYRGLNDVGASPSRSTALACAVRHGRTEVCRLLLELGADMDLLPPFDEEQGKGKKTKAATSLVELAAQFGHLDTMNLLMQATIFKDKAEEECGAVMQDGESEDEGTWI